MKPFIPYIIIALMGIGIVWLLRKPAIPEAMIRRDERAKMLQEIVPTIIAARDSITRKYDSAVNSHQVIIDQLESRKQPIQYVIKNIPATILSYDKEQLRSAITTGN